MLGEPTFPHPAQRATSFAERLRTGAGRRTLGIGLALLVEALLLLLLLSLGSGGLPGGREDGKMIVVNLEANAAAEETSEPDSPEPDQRAQEQPAPRQPAPEQSPPPQIPEPRAAPMPPILPAPQTRPPAAHQPPSRPAPSPKAVYGPPNKGGSAIRDTERVGTAPNGEPLYAAAWYREPRDDELSGYLDTASGPGWGLIACRTAPGYRVEDCVGIAEYPQGSQIARAVLAAAWQFKVRPPRLGGQSQVGAWVRIRIDYSIRRR